MGSLSGREIRLHRRKWPRQEIELNHRIVLSPFAAKRLTQLMHNLMKEYVTRYGVLPGPPGELKRMR
jgi:hypothetical protein